MLKILKKLIDPFIDWVPVFFCWALLYLNPSLYIREISLYISQKKFIIIIQILIWLWLIFTAFDNEHKPFVWKVIDNLVPIELICFVFFLQYHFKSSLVIVGLFVEYSGAFSITSPVLGNHDSREWKSANTWYSMCLDLSRLQAPPVAARP